jgi:hypothetical protein
MLLTPVFRPVTQTALRTKAVLIETADIDVPIVTGLKAGVNQKQESDELSNAFRGPIRWKLLVRSSNGKVQVSRLCADRFYVAALETSGFAQRRLDCFNAATDFFEKRNMRDRWGEGG